MRSFARVLALVLFAAVSARAQLERVPPPPPPLSPPLQPVRVGGNIPPPRKIKDVRPAYPAIAQSARVQGVVIIEATIGPDGRVEDVRVLRSIPMLDAAATDAVKQWEFTPTMLNGTPVPVIMTVTVNFSLQDDLMPRSCADEPSMRSPDGAAPTTIQFVNQTGALRKVYWLDGTGVRHWFLTVEPGEAAMQTTSVGHTWVVTDAQDACNMIFVANGRASRAVLIPMPPGFGVGAPPNVSPRQ